MSNDMNESMSQNSNKFNEFPKLIIWYYRLIGITFGGIKFERNRLLVVNQWLLYLGYVSTIFYLFSGFTFIHFRMHDPDYIALYKSGLTLTYYMSSIILMMNIIQIVVNQLFLNANAIPMIESISKLGLGVKNRTFIYMTFVLILVLRIVVLLFSLALENRTTVTIFGLVLDIFFAKPAADSFLYISFTFSLSISHYYRVLRLSLNNTDITSETISRIRQSFVKTRRQVVRFDRSMLLCQIVTIFHAMLTLMLEIYIMSNYQKIPSLPMRSHYLRISIGSAIRLITSCLVNGMVYDEADQLFFALDGINSFSDRTTQELLIFKTLSRDLPNGFTIGGLLPLRRTTLLTIFSFILTYAVILIQTGAQ